MNYLELNYIRIFLAKIFLFAFFGCYSTFPSALEQEVQMVGETPVATLTGKIEKGDYEKIIGWFGHTNPLMFDPVFGVGGGEFPHFFHLNSPGGDVLEAMKIGDFFRKSMSSLWSGKDCKSACFLMWVGGVKRQLFHPIGVHRPYFDRKYFSGLSFDEADAKQKELEAAVRQYLIKMDVPNSLTDRMMRIPSNRIELFDSKKMYSYISQYQPAYQEWVGSKCVFLTKQEEDLLNYWSKIVTQYRDEEVVDELLAAGGITPEYADFLIKKQGELNLCERIIIKKEREKYFSGLK